jgi:putative ABC transport system substrate-binding protein
MTPCIRRREFLAALGGAAARPLAASAQQPVIPTIGFLDSTTASARAVQVLAFRQGLSEAGFVEGRNVAIEFRWAEGKLDRLSELANDLVRKRVAAIATNAVYSLAAVKAATSTIPTVFVTGGDPVQGGYAPSLNRPAGNVTGISFNSTPLNPKRLELLGELVPKPAALAVLLDPETTRDTASSALEAAARALGRQILVVKPTENELYAAFTSFQQAGIGGLFVAESPNIFARRRQVVLLAARHGLPASFGLREFVELGGLMSYGASSTDAYRRVGTYIGRILKGAKPSELPVEIPTKYELVFNLATAKALNIDIPAKLLALADELLE